MKTRLHQVGSVASFIIIGVVFVLMTTGVLYWVRHKDDAPARQGTPVVTAPKTEKTTPQDEKKDTPSETAPAPAATNPSPSTAETAPVTQPTVTSLSQTGPAGTALELVAVGALVATIAGFTRSRKLRSSL